MFKTIQDKKLIHTGDKCETSGMKLTVGLFVGTQEPFLCQQTREWCILLHSPRERQS